MITDYVTGFLQWFDAVGWVIWPAKIVHDMTYKVSSGMLNFCSLTALLVSLTSRVVERVDCQTTDIVWCTYWCTSRPNMVLISMTHPGGMEGCQVYTVTCCSFSYWPSIRRFGAVYMLTCLLTVNWYYYCALTIDIFRANTCNTYFHYNSLVVMVGVTLK